MDRAGVRVVDAIGGIFLLAAPPDGHGVAVAIEPVLHEASDADGVGIAHALGRSANLNFLSAGSVFRPVKIAVAVRLKAQVYKWRP